MEQLNLFSQLWQTYKIKKPIRLIELFAGYGSQHLALKYLGVNFESHRIAEWAVKSIQAYKDLHCPEDHTNYALDLTQEEITEFLFKKGISADYNQPMTRAQIARLGIEREREIYNNIVATKNLVSVTNIHAEDLNIKNKDKYEYILTYSFPCQDLSLAGKRQLMGKGSGTRSGLLWEVERILLELKDRGELPQVLLMENVTQVHGTGAWEDFEAWKKALKDMGYCNFWQDLIATDYGVPQTRDRTFMVSILGDYNYEFPKPIKLEKRLRDLLEDDVPEKFFLSDKQIEQVENWNAYEKPLETMERVERERVSPTLTTRTGAFAAGMVLVKDTPSLPIKNATQKGYLEAHEGDGVDISSRMEAHRGTVQKGKAQTITTSGGADRGVVVNAHIPSVTGGLQIVGNLFPSNHNAGRIIDPTGNAPTVMENHGSVTAIVVEQNNERE